MNQCLVVRPVTVSKWTYYQVVIYVAHMRRDGIMVWQRGEVRFQCRSKNKATMRAKSMASEMDMPLLNVRQNDPIREAVV
jgi:hypothetical protein